MGDTSKALMVGIASLVGGTIVIGLSKKLANAVVGNPDEIEAQKYEVMHQRLAQRNFYIPRESSSTGTAEPRKQASRSPRSSPSPKKVQSAAVMDHIRGALQELEAAKGVTKCGVCQKGITAAIAAVKDESAVIARADSKFQVLQELKDAGKIPATASWYTLKPKQKEFINKVAEKRSIKS
jgi:hypothetical protein